MLPVVISAQNPGKHASPAVTGGGGPWLGRQVFEWSGPAGLGPQAAGDFGLPVHLQALNANLLAAVSGRNGRFVIAMPPRHGKSFLVSHLLPVWYLRKFPRRRVMLCSYGGRFAGGWGRRARDLFEG
ncbi:MAG TPA: hypothetical protein VNC50_22000, partial [Planctomycetia bacterium]|nr:hypothetical protein [Planctomycetia bacterium]